MRQEQKRGSCLKHPPSPRGKITKGGVSKFLKFFFQNFKIFCSLEFVPTRFPKELNCEFFFKKIRVKTKKMTMAQYEIFGIRQSQFF